MKMTTLLFAVLFFLVGCGSAPTDVAITQTGNPSIVTLGVSVADPAATAIRSVREETVAEEEDPEITSLTITSAELMVAAVVLAGPDTTVEFRKVPPYLVNVALEGSRVVLDSLLVPTGTVFDSMTLIIAPDESSNQLSGKSIAIKGYVNGDMSQTFQFDSELAIPKSVALTTPLVVTENVPNRITVKLAVTNWFIDSDGDYIDPNDSDFKEDIEESILEAIYGEEDHDEEDDDDDEEEEENHGEK